MPDYKSMYFKLFNKVTDAIHILQKAQAEGEDEYIIREDKPILIPLEVSPDDPFNKDKDQE